MYFLMWEKSHDLFRRGECRKEDAIKKMPQRRRCHKEDDAAKKGLSH